MINWMKEAEKYKEQMIRDLEGLIAIPSLRNDAQAKEGAPFGEGPRQALDYMLTLAEKNGFDSEDVDGYAGVKRASVCWGISISFRSVRAGRRNRWR